MDKKELKAKDLLLALLYLPGITGEFNEPIKGRTRITKMFFLFEKEILKHFENFSITNMPEFFAYNYGPFSKDLLDDMGFFSAIGYIKEEILDEEMSEPEREEYCFDINDDIGYGESAICTLDPQLEVCYYLTLEGIKFTKNNVIGQFNKEQIEILSEFKNRINALPLDAILEYVYNKYPESTEKSKIKDKYLKN